MKKTILAVAAITLLVGASSANALTTTYEDGTLQNINGLTGFGTSAADMDGMSITVTYSDSTQGTYTWGDLGGGVSGASFGSAGSLSFSGDSWANAWNLDVTDADYEIDSIFIDAMVGNAVFDVWYYEKPIGSTDSAYGRAFEVISGDASNITATYSGAIGINGAAPVGDLYRYLNIDFTGSGDDSFGSTDTLSFISDTDSIANPVPEPSTVLLFGLGIAGLVGFKRRSSSKKN